jgi:hypothetical protein
MLILVQGLTVDRICATNAETLAFENSARKFSGVKDLSKNSLNYYPSSFLGGYLYFTLLIIFLDNFYYIPE